MDSGARNVTIAGNTFANNTAYVRTTRPLSVFPVLLFCYINTLGVYGKLFLAIDGASPQHVGRCLIARIHRLAFLRGIRMH